jgi:hypothetical protein
MGRREQMQEYIGRCTCGYLELRLQSRLAPEQFQPRSDAPTCGFCREYDGVWISDPKGTLELPPAYPTSVRRFGSGQVRFHLCPTCNELAYAVFGDEARDGVVAVARVALFKVIRVVAQSVDVTTFEGEATAAGRQRRLHRWTPVSRR